MTNNATRILAASVATLSVVATLFIRFGVSSNVRGFYINEYSTITASSTERQTAASWLSGQGANLAAIYGATSDMTTTSGRAKVSDLVLRYRRSGVRSIGYPYGSSSGVLSNLNTYNRSVTDSAKFDFVVSEIEPYNTGDYAGFYKSLREVSNWTKANGLQSAVYMGWPSEAAWDSIARNASRVYLHCYRPSASMSGSSQFGYCRTRLVTLAAKAKAIKKRVSVVIIYSCEPDFSYTYFQGNSWWKPIEDFKAAWNTSATSDMKQWLSVDGTMIFVSRYAKEIKP